jgi:calcium/proton exchanger cax
MELVHTPTHHIQHQRHHQKQQTTEMVIGVQALAKGEIRVVQASMLGSILSNLLLVTGACLFWGGLCVSIESVNQTSKPTKMN